MNNNHIFLSKELSIVDYLCRNIVVGDVFKSFTINDIWVHCNRLSLLSDVSVSNGYQKSDLREFIINSDLFELVMSGDDSYTIPDTGKNKSNLRVVFGYRLRKDKIGFDYNYTIESNKAIKRFLLDKFNVRGEYENYPIALIRSMFLFYKDSDSTDNYYRMLRMQDKDTKNGG